MAAARRKIPTYRVSMSVYAFFISFNPIRVFVPSHFGWTPWLLELSAVFRDEFLAVSAVSLTMMRVAGLVPWMLWSCAAAEPLVFEHLGTTWTIAVKDSELEVTADCAENTWCGFGFNKDIPEMSGSDVFTFGYHATADLVDCPTKGCGTCGCGCGCGTTRRLRQPENPYIPRARDLKVQLPKASAPGTPKGLGKLGGVVGIAMNGVLFVHEHPEEGWTWLFDNCGGHGDTYGHYHYHAPPLCLLKTMGLPVPKNSSWWKFEGEKAWPKSGPEVQVGWALDGAPIMGPFKAGVRTEKKLLDECHGAVDETTGEYRYYLVPEAPYVPPCLRGAQLGKVENFRSSKEGQPCSRSGAQQVEISTMEGGKVITGNGCPEHAMFKKVQRGLPFDFKGKIVRKLHNHGGGHNYGTCPADAGGCGCGCGSTACGCGTTCGCGCGTTTATACGCGTTCGCGCGTTAPVSPCAAKCGCCGTPAAACGCGTTCGCGCGTTTAAACGCGTTCGCGCGTTTAAACGCGTTCGCGCGTTTAAACGCGTTCGCGCGTTTAAACGCGTTCGCGCGTTTAAACGCGTTCGCGNTCGSGCGCGCGAGCGVTYKCMGQMFCAKGLTKQGPVLTVPVSLSQCNGFPGSITIDEKQDLTSYSLTFEGGRMKASAKRAFNTGDATDYVLSANTPYYILITVGSAAGNGPAYQVGYHGSSATQTLVCESTLTMKGACKAPSEWSGAPSLASIEAEADDSKTPALSGAITMALLLLAWHWA